MAYNFKSIADVEVVTEPTETANVLIEEDGIIKKAPKTAVGGSGKYDLVIFYEREEGMAQIESGSYQNVYNKIMVDQEEPRILVKYHDRYYQDAYGVISSFDVASIVVYSDGENYLYLSYHTFNWEHNLRVYPNGKIDT